MNNIFKNAYFGKEYRTRDGRKAIFHRNANDKVWYLIKEDIHDRIPYNADGTCRGDNCHDIVAEWQEEVNEEELEELIIETIKEKDKISKQCEGLGQCYGYSYVDILKEVLHKLIKNK